MEPKNNPKVEIIAGLYQGYTGEYLEAGKQPGTSLVLISQDNGIPRRTVVSDNVIKFLKEPQSSKLSPQMIEGLKLLAARADGNDRLPSPRGVTQRALAKRGLARPMFDIPNSMHEITPEGRKALEQLSQGKEPEPPAPPDGSFLEEISQLFPVYAQGRKFNIRVHGMEGNWDYRLETDTGTLLAESAGFKTRQQVIDLCNTLIAQHIRDERESLRNVGVVVTSEEEAEAILAGKTDSDRSERNIPPTLPNVSTPELRSKVGRRMVKYHLDHSRNPSKSCDVVSVPNPRGYYYWGARIGDVRVIFQYRYGKLIYIGEQDADPMFPEGTLVRFTLGDGLERVGEYQRQSLQVGWSLIKTPVNTYEVKNHKITRIEPEPDSEAPGCPPPVDPVIERRSVARKMITQFRKLNLRDDSNPKTITVRTQGKTFTGEVKFFRGSGLNYPRYEVKIGKLLNVFTAVHNRICFGRECDAEPLFPKGTPVRNVKMPGQVGEYLETCPSHVGWSEVKYQGKIFTVNNDWLERLPETDQESRG